MGTESNVVIRFPATICSISRNGARLDVPRWALAYFHPGKMATVRIEHPALKENELRCRVVWLNDSQLAVTFAGRPKFAQLDAVIASAAVRSRPALASGADVSL